jgi:hypothetical protein
MALFTTALGLYGGVLWSGELQGFIIHQMVPTPGNRESRCEVPPPGSGSGSIPVSISPCPLSVVRAHMMPTTTTNHKKKTKNTRWSKRGGAS